MINFKPRLARTLDWLREHRWSFLLFFIGVLIPLWAFGKLAEEVVEQDPFSFDEPFLRFLHQSANPTLDQLMVLFSLVGNRYGVDPALILGFFLLLHRKRWGDAFFWGIANGGAGLLNLIAKPFFGRPRPDLWLSLAPETNFSFPSAHAMGSMAFVAALIVLSWPTSFRWPVIGLGTFFVFMVGLSRIYLGVHYPSDILAGWAASLSWVLGVSFIFYHKPVKPTPYAEPA